VLASTCHWSMSWARLIQFILSHLISSRPILISASHLHLGLQSGFSPACFPPKLCTHFSSSPYRPHGQPISFSLTRSPEQYLVSSTIHKAPHYPIFCSLLLLPPLRPKTS
jgi:hypothetical protein